MNRNSRTQMYNQQMAQSMAEMRAMMSRGQSPTGD
jgi:hypothetical protein